MRIWGMVRTRTGRLQGISGTQVLENADLVGDYSYYIQFQMVACDRGRGGAMQTYLIPFRGCKARCFLAVSGSLVLREIGS